MPQKSRYTIVQQKEMCSLYKDGWDTYKIGEKFACDHGTVNYYLRKYKVPRRSAKEAISKEARQRLSKARQGKGSPTWKGGKTDGLGYSYQFNPSSRKGKNLTKFILERDNYECQMCGKPHKYGKGQFMRHHIDGDKSNNNTNNIILLCNKCHQNVHEIGIGNDVIYKHALKTIKINKNEQK